MRATIKMIAERAGVSIGTVDRVLHDRPYVKAEVRQRVLAVMEELDYRPNHMASALATSGTVASCSYQRMCAAEGIGCAVPSEADQAALMNTIIYGQIKSGKPVDLELFGRIADGLKAQGCQKAVLGCTELSLIKRDYGLDDFFIDSTEVLAKATIEACGKTPVGFDF